MLRTLNLVHDMRTHLSIKRVIAGSRTQLWNGLFMVEFEHFFRASLPESEVDARQLGLAVCQLVSDNRELTEQVLLLVLRVSKPSVNVTDHIKRVYTLDVRWRDLYQWLIPSNRL